MAEQTSRLVFRTLNGEWSADGQGPYVDDVVIEDASPELVRLASHAHAAGALDVTEGLDLSDVESQKDSLKALRESMGEHVLVQNRDGTRRGYWTGPWHEGNLQQQIISWTQRLDELRDRLPAQVEGVEPDDETAADLQEIARKERYIAQAQAELELVLVTSEGSE